MRCASACASREEEPTVSARFAVPLPLLLLLVAAGCLESTTESRVGMDGAGTFVQTTSVHVDKARAWLELLRTEARQREGEPHDPFPIVDLDVERRVRALKEQPGLLDVEGKATVDETRGVHGYVLRLRFAKLASLLESSAFEQVDPTLERTEEGHWRLTLRSTLLDGDDVPPDGAAAAELAALRRKLLERFEPYWKDMRVETTIALPTRVVATNGRLDDTERAVTWRAGFADLADPARLTWTVTFEDAEGLALEPYPRRP
jgi:hypothetical protein